VSTFAGESFDKDLISSADSVVGRLRVKAGKVVVDLPPAALAILKHDDSDKLYFRVLQADGRFISGDSELPPPSVDLQIDVPKVMTAKIAGKEIRLAEIKVLPDDEKVEPVIVQVAETTRVRQNFQKKMLLSIAVPQLLVIFVSLLAVCYGVIRILTPMKLLQRQLENRSQADLSMVSDKGIPEEVYPLIETINHSFERLTEEVKAHQRFIANAAHQLRTPLAGLKTYSSIGRDMTNLDDLRHIVHEMDLGLDRAGRMVSQLLALARTDSGDLSVTGTQTPVDLCALVADEINDLMEQAEKRQIQLTFDAPVGAAMIRADKTGLRHLIVNLIENALFYTPAGGHVVVSIQQDNHVILRVTDDGPGIPSSQRESVFERFYRVVGTNGNGSGLGLSIVKEVANAHHALVAIENGFEGKGTSVVVRFSPAS